MRRRIAVYGVTPEVLPLLQALGARADLEVVAAFDPEARVLRRRLALLEPACAALLQRTLTDDPLELEGDPALDAAIDSGITPPFRERFASLVGGGLEVLTPAAARLAWRLEGAQPPAPEPIPAAAPDRTPREELLTALGEIADAAALADEPDALCARLLETALAATGATHGSVLVPEAGELVVRAAVGLEPTLWPAARRPAGEGVAGRAAALGRPLLLRGPIDPMRFSAARERFDVAAALIAPLRDEETTAGVLCLHHPTRGDLFDDTDLRFAEAFARPAAQLLRRAVAADARRRRLACDEAAREVRERLAAAEPLSTRLAALCRLAAERAGGGSATLWLRPTGDGEARLAASSHAGGTLAGALRLAPGEGVDGRVLRDGEPALLRRDDALVYAALPLAGSGVLAVQAGERAPRVDLEPVLAEIAATAGRELARIDGEERARACGLRADALHEAALRLLALQDVDEIARFAAASGALGLDAVHAVVRVRAGTRFPVRSYDGPASDPERAELLALDRAAAREALRRGALVGERDLGPDEEHALLAAPLIAAGAPLGTLAVYGRRSGPGSAPFGFDADERAWLERLARYAAHALERAAAPAPPAEVEASPPHPLEARIEAELAARSRFAIVSISIEGGVQPDAARALRLAGEGVRAHLGERGVAVESEGRILVLLPLSHGSEPVAQLARAVAEHVSKHHGEGDARPALAFGYARHPEDGADAQALLARAAAPRIRML